MRMVIRCKGLLLENTHSNNEAEYVALALGLDWCVDMGIKRQNVLVMLFYLLNGTWVCRNQSLVLPRLRRVKKLMKRFKSIQLYHVPRKENEEANALASEQIHEVTMGAIQLQKPLFQGNNCMHDIVNLLEIGECPQDMSKGQQQWLVCKATKYRLINEHLYCKGKELVFRRVPHSKDIKQVLTSYHEGVCGGHFAHDITSRKILQTVFWGNDAIGPLLRATSGKLYIIMGVNYMTKSAEAITYARITAKEVPKFLYESICSDEAAMSSLSSTIVAASFGSSSLVKFGGGACDGACGEAALEIVGL
ncbi:hypothetical protein L7F22_017742 [Adiantum nelumboides]|nr:hypothetical protein [Adiantum nelumboides]